MTRMTTKTFGARFFALLTVFSLIISAFPAPFFVAEAAAGSTTLFSEDFESGFAQWSTTGSWSIVGAGGGSDGSKARALGPTPIGLLVASIPTTGYENIHISFAYRGTLDTGDSVLSGYNYDTTTSGISISAFNQTNAGDGVWHTFDQDLGPLADDNADFKIYFSPNSMDSGSDEFDVDTIIVTGDPISTTPDCSSTDTVADTTFDTFSLGDVDGQNDWSSTGSFDQEVVENTYGYDSFGCQSLRISNAVTSSSFGDQTFAAPFSDSVGEVDATAGGFPEGTRRTHYEAQFDIASTKPTEQQSGLALSVSPDRGDGSRMSYLSFADGASGIDVTFYDTQGTGNPADFVPQSLGTLDRSMPHTIKFVIDTKDGHSNDTVDIFIDGSLVYSGTTWENYYRFDSEAVAEQSPRLLKTILFRAAGTAVPANSGEGFLIDNLSLTASDPAPVVKSSNTITIMGDTAAGENQPGWLFNRDLSNATPIEFNTDAASIGAGSLYVQPLDSTPAHKFIGEYFLFGDIADLDEVTYDYQIGSGGSASDANEFYLNVYANYGESAPDNYYDCKYDVVPTVGSTGSFTTVTFDPNQSYPVTTRGTSPYTCPTVPAAMNFQSAGSIIRMFALNMGDTTAGDTGLDGYFDNVVVETKTDITTFDFDPDTTKPTVAIVSPAQAEVTGMDVTAFGTATDTDSGIERVDYTVTQITGIGGSFVANIDSGTATGTENWEFAVNGLATGFYRFKVQAFDNAGNFKYAYHDIEVDAEKPSVNIDTPDHGAVVVAGMVHATGTATDAQTSITEVKYTVTEIDGIGGTYVANVASGVANGTENWDFWVELLTPGFYRLKVQAFDEDGNWRYKYHDIEVVEPDLSDVMICKVDMDEEPLEGWTLMLKQAHVEDLSVDAGDMAGADTVSTLMSGMSYIAEVVGSWFNAGGNGGKGNEADAEYVSADGWSTYTDGPAVGANNLDLQIDDSFVHWGTYSSGHMYAASFAGNDTTTNFRVFDGSGSTPNAGWYNDNDGSLDVSIFGGYAGVTDAKGCVFFEDVPYGEYTIEEVMQDGWYYNSGAGPVTIDEDEEEFTVVNSDTEPVEASLVITDPATDYEVLTGEHTFLAEYVDGDADPDTVQWAIRAGTCAASTGTVAGNVDGYNTPFTFDGANFESTIDMSSWADGDYCLVVNPVEDSGPNLRETRWFTLDNPDPAICEVGVNLLENPSFEEPSIEGNWELVDPIGWLVSLVSGGDPAPMEIQRNVNGWLPSEGEQYAELAGDKDSIFSQTVPTVAGETYVLSWDYSPRPGRSFADNRMEVFADGVQIDANQEEGGSLSNTDWTTYTATFVGTGDDVLIEFKDDGKSNSYGPFLDNTSLVCDPFYEEEELYQIFGYVWEDSNENGDIDDGEDLLPGWNVIITNGTVTATSTSGTDGYYEFNVPAGTWTISEPLPPGWEHTHPSVDGGTHTVIVPTVVTYGGSTGFLAAIKSFFVPVAYAQAAPGAGPFNFGQVQVPACTLTASPDMFSSGSGTATLTWTTINSDSQTLSDVGAVATSGSVDVLVTNDTTFTLTVTRGNDSADCSASVDVEASGGGSRTTGTSGGGSTTPDGQVAGDSDSQGGEPKVLGDSDSIIPTGAPNTGAGGAAHTDNALTVYALVLLAFVSTLWRYRRSI